MSDDLTAAQMLEQLKAMMAGQQQPAAAAQPMAAPAHTAPQSFGMPAQQQLGPMMGPMMGGPFPMQQQPQFGPQGAAPQPTGVGVPVKIPLPDGREMTVRVEFGPEWAGRLQELGAVVLQMFGPYLSAWYPKQQGGYGNSGNYGGGGYGGGYGGRGRRW